MSAPELVSFLTIAERELSAGTAVNEGGKLNVTQLKLVAGKEFDDARDELKEFVGAQASIVAQSALPFSVLQAKAGEISSAEALLAFAHKNSGMDPADTRIAVVPSASGPVIVCIGKSALATGIQQVASAGAKNVKLFCRGVNTLAAIVESVDAGKIDKPVLMLDILNANTHMVVASKSNVADLGAIDAGTDAILEQVMAALSLKFPGSAAKLFYGDLYDFDEHAAKLISVLAEKAKARLGQSNGKTPAPAYLYASGLPSSRTALLGGKLAEALGLTFVSSPLTLEGSGLPAYYGTAALGLAKIVQSSGNGAWMLNLAAPETDAAALVATLGAKPAAPTPAAPAKPVATNGKPQAPAPAAKPVVTNGKPGSAQQKPVQKKFEPAKKPEPPKPVMPAPAKPVAAAPAPKEQPAAPAQQPAKSATFAAPKPAKKPNIALYGGIAAAVVVIAVVAIIVSGGKKATSARESALQAAAHTAQTPEPAKPAAPVPAKPANTPASPAQPAPQTPAKPAPVVVAQPPAPEPPPPPTTGNISIQTKPVDAEVYVDGQLKGLTPLMVYDMPIGTYTVEIRKDNYKSYKKTVEITGGQTETIKNVALELDRGKLTVGSEPDEVSFTIKPLTPGAGADNPAHLKGTTPADIDDLAPGKYLVSYMREGWKTYEQTIEVKAGDKAKTSFEYKPGKVHIVTTPDGADVFSNGKKIGETPLNLDDVPEGVFDASIRLNGYESEVVKADVAFGGSVSRELRLLRLDRVVTNAVELDVLPSRAGGAVVVGSSSALGGFSGILNVRCTIAASGKVENSEIVYIPNNLTPAAATFVRNAIRNWTFNPGSRKGVAMRTEVVIPVTVRAQ
jgi:hypothetical protein